jgi:hypothetical protein
MKLDDPGHKNPALAAVFDAAVPEITHILDEGNTGYFLIQILGHSIKI